MKSLPSPVEMQLLALVADREMSGRDVAKLYELQTGTAISYGTLYTTFRRLKESGWVKVREDEDEDGRVRFFQIDIDGRKALQEGREHYRRISQFGLPELRNV
jgi:DNA-binding PadR family transcriptional regulator